MDDNFTIYGILTHYYPLRDAFFHRLSFYFTKNPERHFVRFFQHVCHETCFSLFIFGGFRNIPYLCKE